MDDKIVIYETSDGETTIDVKLEGETVRRTHSQMAELFQTDSTSVLKHIKNIYNTEELTGSATCTKIARVRKEEARTVSRSFPFYNLDMIISVSYRINSKRGTQFRIWANKVLKTDDCNGTHRLK